MRNIALTDDVSTATAASPEIEAELTSLRQILIDLGRLRSLRDPLATMCEELELSPAQLHCIVWLGTEMTLTMGDLARRLGVTEKTMTGVVDRLETSLHLKRERDQPDRRVVRVRLTDAGREIYEKIDSEVQGKLRYLLNVLDAEDRRSISRVLERLRDRLMAQAQRPDEETK